MLAKPYPELLHCGECQKLACSAADAACVSGRRQLEVRPPGRSFGELSEEQCSRCILLILAFEPLRHSLQCWNTRHALSRVISDRAQLSGRSRNWVVGRHLDELLQLFRGAQRPAASMN